MTRRITLAGVVVGLLSGCPDRSLAVVEPQQGRVEFKDIPVNLNRDVDILFMVDDSPSMTDKQMNLKANFPHFIDTLDTIEGGLPNVHIGVVTSDLGVKGADDAVAGNFTVQGDGAGCSGYGKDGNMQLGGAPVTGRYIVDTLNTDGTRTQNYTGNLSDVFSQMATVGEQGCGFEQSLEAVHRALNNNPANAGFLRYNAYLAVILLSDEDDCSLAHSTVIDPTNATFGPVKSFRCTHYGVTCGAGGATPDQMNQVGGKDQCQSDESRTYLTDVQRYVDFLKGLKGDPNNVIVADIGGPPTPVATELRPDGLGNMVPALSHSCNYTGADGLLEVADPTVRVDQFLGKFPNRSFSTICQSDLSGGLSEIALLLKNVIGNPCIQGTLSTPYDCSISDVQNYGKANETDQVLPQCSTNGDVKPCWTIAADPMHCPTASQLSLQVERDFPPAAGTHVVAYCVTEAQ